MIIWRRSAYIQWSQ